MTSRFPSERQAKRDALLEAVEGVRKVVEASAIEAEEQRSLPLKAVDAIYNAGLFSMKVPEVLGGAEADPVTQIEVVEAPRLHTKPGDRRQKRWLLQIAALRFPDHRNALAETQGCCSPPPILEC